MGMSPDGVARPTRRPIRPPVGTIAAELKNDALFDYCASLVGVKIL